VELPDVLVDSMIQSQDLLPLLAEVFETGKRAVERLEACWPVIIAKRAHNRSIGNWLPMGGQACMAPR